MRILRDVVANESYIDLVDLNGWDLRFSFRENPKGLPEIHIDFASSSFALKVESGMADPHAKRKSERWKQLGVWNKWQSIEGPGILFTQYEGTYIGDFICLDESQMKKLETFLRDTLRTYRNVLVLSDIPKVCNGNWRNPKSDYLTYAMRSGEILCMDEFQEGETLKSSLRYYKSLGQLLIDKKPQGWLYTDSYHNPTQVVKEKEHGWAEGVLVDEGFLKYTRKML